MMHILKFICSAWSVGMLLLVIPFVAPSANSTTDPIELQPETTHPIHDTTTREDVIQLFPAKIDALKEAKERHRLGLLLAHKQIINKLGNPDYVTLIKEMIKEFNTVVHKPY